MVPAEVVPGAIIMEKNGGAPAAVATGPGESAEPGFWSCFAILFLKRAIRPLVASEDSRRKAR